MLYRSLSSISPWGVVPPTSGRVSRVPPYSGYRAPRLGFGYGALTRYGRLSQSRSPTLPRTLVRSVTPMDESTGLGCSPSARRYSGNRVFFLFLRVLRCFSSPGSPPCAMDSRMDTGGLPQWVAPFRDLRVNGYLPLAAAYRSLSRLSSALSAKASALRPY